MGWMSTYIVDALMIGRLPHSALSISASSLGNVIYYAIAFCVIQLMTGLQTLVAQQYGRGDRESGVKTLMQTMWIVVVGTPLVMLLTLGAVPLLPHFGTPPEIVAETSRYLHPLVWSTAPLLLYMALRKYLQSIEKVMLVMISLVTASVVNFAGDWAFLYGHLGLPAMGMAGSAWATCVVRVYMLGLLLVGVWRSLRAQDRSVTFARLLRMMRPDWIRLKMLLRIGWPTSLESLTDLGVSTYMTILCARLGATLLAAHQVVLDLDAFVFMVPAGLSYATVVRVGQGAGRGSLPQVRRAGNASLLLGMGFIFIAAGAFASFPHLWASLYTTDTAVVMAAAPIFLICGFQQLGDAAGAVLGYSLYGIGDTRTPFLVNTFWSWVLGMPLSYWLMFDSGMSLRGLWLGRAVAALGSAATLAIFWRVRLHALEAPGPSRTLTLSTPIGA